MQRKLTLLFGLIGVLLVSACVSNSIDGTPEVPTVTTTPESTLTPTPTINAELPAYTSATLEIIRNGKKYSILLGYNIGEAFWYATPHPDVDMIKWLGDVRDVSSANIKRYGDFDFDGEKEYLVAIYGLNAGDILLLAIDYDKSTDEYKIFDKVDFDRLDDIEQDGIPEIITRDFSFHYESGGAVADSAFSPIKIFHYNGQKFVSVTKDYPDLIEGNAQHWLEMIDNNALGQGQFGSIYASYLADMYLLGKKEEGNNIFSDQCIKRLAPHIKIQSPQSTWDCGEFLIRVQNALSKSGYD